MILVRFRESMPEGHRELGTKQRTWISLGLAPLCQQIIMRLADLLPYHMMFVTFCHGRSRLTLLVVV